MSTYSFACPKCGLTCIFFHPIDRRDQPVHCAVCGTRVIIAFPTRT